MIEVKCERDDVYNGNILSDKKRNTPGSLQGENR
jgi:hypothetical protein